MTGGDNGGAGGTLDAGGTGGALEGYDASAHEFLLGAEALRIKNASPFDERIALRTSDVDALPHQIYAVYHEMLPRLPRLRYLLADDPGAGKTIMAGLLIKEALLQNVIRRVLIVCPGGLAAQWQEEMQSKFHLPFDIITSGGIANGGERCELCIGRLDVLSRSEDAMNALEKVLWDLVIVDEAHKMSAAVFGEKRSYTKRYRLGEVLSRNTQSLLLMTATPHNGKDEDFKMFMALLDHDRFGGAALSRNERIDTNGVMLRRVKEDLRRMDGSPLFPKRKATTLEYPLSQEEQSLYDAVTDYVRSGMGRVERLDKNKRYAVGFALMVLQRRLASSPNAIYKSLRRRRQKLEDALSKAKSGEAAINSEQDDMLMYAAADDDYVTIETEAAEDKIASMATSSLTIAEYEAEIAQLMQLEKQAKKLLDDGHDCKWDELSATLQKEKDIFEEGRREKIIIFTEHRDTLDYLEANIKNLLENYGVIVVVIHGGLTRAKRLDAVETFRHNEKASVLVATDAAGEGVNLQCAHLMINYDLPWNPNRLEQRFGRIHRIGQEKTCHLWNMVAKSTREGEVFSRLLEKLENERAVLGGKVFDVLGALQFGGKSLRDLLMDAVCASESEKHLIIDTLGSAAMHEGIKKALAESEKDSRPFAEHDAVAIADEMWRIEMERMQPYYIEQFFVTAFKEAGGKMAGRGGGKVRRYEILQVGNDIKKHDAALKRSSACVCFDKDGENEAGGKKAQIIGLGSPLLNALVAATLERCAAALERGALLADDGDEIRLLFITQDTVVDAMGREVSRRMHFIEMKEDGTFIDEAKPPCVDCRPLNDWETRRAKEIISLKTWLAQDTKAVVSYCENNTGARLLEEEKSKRLPLLKREAKDVDDSFFYLINNADAQYGMVRYAASGYSPTNDTYSKNNALALRRRRDDTLKELQAKIDMRLDTPRVLGRAVIIPSDMLRYAPGGEAITRYAADSAERKRIENIAMQAVMDKEKELGFTPIDVSASNLGYDIESNAPRGEGGRMRRVIEVKGVGEAKDEVTVTRGEVNGSFAVRDNGGCYILAVVMVGKAALHLTYIRFPFENRLDKSANHTDYDVKKLKQGDVILDVPLG